MSETMSPAATTDQRYFAHELCAWFRRRFRSRVQTPPGPDAALKRPLIKLERAAAVEVPFELLEALPRAYAPGARVAPAMDAPETEALAAAVRALFAQRQLELPSFPPLAAQVFGTIEHPDFELNELVQLVRRDPTMAAEVLAMANSMLFAASEPTENIRDAVVRLGARETAKAVSAVSARALFDLEARGSQDLFGPLWKQLWSHAMVTAFSASWAAMTLRKGNLDRLFLAGMLHDIGKTVALRALGQLFMSGTPQPGPEVLHAVLEVVHVELALEVARSWHLSDAVLAAVAGHHAPVPGDESAALVQLVSALEELRSNPHHRDGLEAEVRGAAEALRLTVPQQRALLTQLLELEARVATLA